MNETNLRMIFLAPGVPMMLQPGELEEHSAAGVVFFVIPFYSLVFLFTAQTIVFFFPEALKWMPSRPNVFIYFLIIH